MFTLLLYVKLMLVLMTVRGLSNRLISDFEASLAVKEAELIQNFIATLAVKEAKRKNELTCALVS